MKKKKAIFIFFFLVGSCYIAQTALNDDPPASASEALGYRCAAATPAYAKLFLHCEIT